MSNWIYDPITVEELRLVEILTGSYFYEEGLVKEIEKFVDGSVYQNTLGKSGQYVELISAGADIAFTIKIEGMEKFNKKLWTLCDLVVNGQHCPRFLFRPFSCHCFIASGTNAPSFDTHSDPDQVSLYVIEGQKDVYIPSEDKWFTIKEGQMLRIPANVPHRIENQEASVMLSIGHDTFYSEKMDA